MKMSIPYEELINMFVYLCNSIYIVPKIFPVLDKLRKQLILTNLLKNANKINL